MIRVYQHCKAIIVSWLILPLLSAMVTAQISTLGVETGPSGPERRAQAQDDKTMLLLGGVIAAVLILAWVIYNRRQGK